MGAIISKVGLIKKLSIGFFFVLPIYLNPLTFESKSLLFLGYSLVGIVLIFLIKQRLPSTIIWVSPILIALATLSYVLNLKSAETMSFLYSVFFIVAYITFISNFKAVVAEEDFIKLVRAMIVSFFVVVLLGQVYVALGLFQGIYIAKGIVHGPFGTLFEVPGGFRFYSLSTEPSYAAFIVIVLLFVYTEHVERLGEQVWRRKHVLTVLMCLYMLVSFQSGYGFILLAVFLFFKLKLRTGLMIVLAGISVFLIAVYLELPAVARFTNIFQKFDINNFESIKGADHSASFRVLPFYYYIKNINPFNYHFYFGYGAGTSSAFLIPFLFNVPVDSYEGGFLPQFVYDYGLVFLVVFLYFLIKESIVKFISFPTFVVFLMMTNANFNTQLFWFVIACFALHKWYVRFYKKPLPLSETISNPKPVTYQDPL